MVAIGKVGAPDRALEQHVAEYGKVRGVVDEDDVARGVTRAVQDLEAVLAKGNGIALGQP
jgi:hypothetical protein